MISPRKLYETRSGDPDYTKLEDISPVFKEAIISTEDISFMSHKGFDYYMIYNAIKKNIKSRSIKTGASTISMQLSRNLYLSFKRKITRKLLEAAVTVILERELTKDEILEFYLNIIDFGNGCFGITDACRFYFNCTPSQLDIDRSIALVTLVPGPVYLNPFLHPDRYIKHREHVLDILRRVKMIDADYTEKALDGLFAIQGEILTDETVCPVNKAAKELLKRARRTTKTDCPVTEITSESRIFDLKLKEVWKYRGLIVIFAKKDLLVRYKQTVFGMLWLFITPLLSVIPYWFLFGEIAGLGTGGIPRILFYMCGSGLWGFFSGIFIRNSTIFSSNSYLFGKIYFPRLTVALSYGVSAGVIFLIQFAILIPFLVYYICKDAVSPNICFFLLLPLILVEMMLMATGMGILFSSFTTRYKDLNIISGIFVNACMYITPVVYPLSQVESTVMRTLVLINPVTMPVESFRYILFGNGTLVPWSIIWSCLFSLIVCTGGIVLFNRVERTFMDTV